MKQKTPDGAVRPCASRRPIAGEFNPLSNPLSCDPMSDAVRGYAMSPRFAPGGMISLAEWVEPFVSYGFADVERLYVVRGYECRTI